MSLVIIHLIHPYHEYISLTILIIMISWQQELSVFCVLYLQIHCSAKPLAIGVPRERG